MFYTFISQTTAVQGIILRAQIIIVWQQISSAMEMMTVETKVTRKQYVQVKDKGILVKIPIIST